MAGTCEHGNELTGSINAGNFLTSSKPVNFSRRTLLHGVSKYILYICGLLPNSTVQPAPAGCWTVMV
jgi:hypothetical protein